MEGDLTKKQHQMVKLQVSNILIQALLNVALQEQVVQTLTGSHWNVDPEAPVESEEAHQINTLYDHILQSARGLCASLPIIDG